MQALIISAPKELRDQLRNLTRMQLIRTLAEWRPDLSGCRDPVTATRIALKSLARRYLELHDEIADLEVPMHALVDELAANLLARTGIGYESAIQLLITAGDNPDRLVSEAPFAMLCGAAPQSASSGKTLIAALGASFNARSDSTLPSWARGVTLRIRANVAWAACSASMVSSLPRLRRSVLSPAVTSSTSMPAASR